MNFLSMLIVVTGPLLFFFAQGCAVFFTAFVALKLLKWQNWFSKCFAMLISYVSWIALALFAYFSAGGEGGFMDGGEMVMLLCASTLVSSVIFTAGWIIVPNLRKKVND